MPKSTDNSAKHVTRSPARFLALTLFSLSITGNAWISTANASDNSGTPKLQAQVAKSAPLAPLKSSASSFKLQGKAEVFGQEVESSVLKRMTPYLGFDTSLPLKGQTEALADGTKLFTLKDARLFDREQAHLIPAAATVDLTSGYVKDTVYKAFAKMDCLEFTALGANYYTAPDFYKPLQYGGRSIAIGATQKSACPVLKMTVAGHVESVPMKLPGLDTSSHNVMVLTDNLHVVSIDPRTHDTWQLQLRGTPGKQNAVWQKLTHPNSRFAAIVKNAL